jgi:hypothetical protein
MNRLVEPELLDSLPASDPRAVRSRADLRRLNALMDHSGIMLHSLTGSVSNDRRFRIAELGAGDGTFSLKLARRLERAGLQADLMLVDQQNIVAAGTLAEFTAIGWRPEVVQADVFQWLASGPSVDWVLANLFLHHFPRNQLTELLRLAATKTSLLVACEPRRGRFAMSAASILGLIGCNEITRHDAVASVRAGFAGRELSDLWPAGPEWRLAEDAAGFFSHCFSARRLTRRAPVSPTA